MRRLNIEGASRHSEILLGGKLQDLPERAPRERSVLVTDPTVRHHWGHRMEGYRVLEIGLGEGQKTLATVEALYGGFLDLGVDRGTTIVAVGGGLVCDVAGFAASTFLRGLDFGFVASTLLAQVDASVGGKNGVNFHRLKNLVGTFTQPRFVVCDFGLLATLPDREYACGLAELVKTAAIEDRALFETLEIHAEGLLARDPGLLEEVVGRAVAIKARIVTADETERGERRKLNFGHTLGHAIESLEGLPHGEAVALGMVAAAGLSWKLTGLEAAEAERLERLLERLGLPTRINMDPERLLPLVGKDKKRLGAQVDFILLEALGRSVIRPLGLEQLREALS